MNTKEISNRIKEIRDLEGDDESQHALEDKLREDFIRYVSTLDNHNIAAKAKLVLTTGKIDFNRWYA